jgi:hypothetical protein
MRRSGIPVSHDAQFVADLQEPAAFGRAEGLGAGEPT